MTTTVRVWRLRKAHVARRLHARRRGCSVEIQFFYDGAPLFARRWRSREQALTDAENQLRDLLRAGWTTHW